MNSVKIQLYLWNIQRKNLLKFFLNDFQKTKIYSMGYCKSSNKKVATVPEKIATPLKLRITSAQHVKHRKTLKYYSMFFGNQNCFLKFIYYDCMLCVGFSFRFLHISSYIIVLVWFSTFILRIEVFKSLIITKTTFINNEKNLLLNVTLSFADIII